MLRRRFSIIVFASTALLQAQWTGSGSTGADGALNLTTPGIVVFDPRSFDSPLKSSDENIYNFTSIYVGKGVTVKLSSQKLRGPVFWLAQGPVIIEGSIDVNGSDGEVRLPSIPGAGGFPGGAPSKAAYRPGSFEPNVFLVPLAGGFGGDGGETGGGGAGGGAILIASSTSITINGSIAANGGASTRGIGGDGGAIRLVAPTIEGSGSLSARGGQPEGLDGLVRFEATNNQFAGSLNNTPSAQGKPFGLFLPSTQPSVRIVSIAVNAPAVPSNRGTPSTSVLVEAHFIPLGTTLELVVYAGDGTSQSVMTTPLTGSLESSRATATVTPRTGSGMPIVRVEWKPPQTDRLSK
jgi:hypothetical protein